MRGALAAAVFGPVTVDIDGAKLICSFWYHGFDEGLFWRVDISSSNLTTTLAALFNFRDSTHHNPHEGAIHF